MDGHAGGLLHPHEQRQQINMPPIFSPLRAACLAALLLAGADALAQQDARSRDEIHHLLDYLGHSGCQFDRNGSWYDAPAAREHLQDKYAYLQKRDLAPDAQAFIDRAASKSSMSGRAYRVRCGNGEPVPSSRWLGAELERYRAAQRKGP
jgi:hypothetical protein